MPKNGEYLVTVDGDYESQVTCDTSDYINRSTLTMDTINGAFIEGTDTVNIVN